MLIADADPTSVGLVERCLDVLRLVNPRLHARDGDEAIAILGDCAAGRLELPALVLLDVPLPGRSGLEVLAWMRQDPRLSHVPVVVLTADGSLPSIRAAYASGLASYLVKPVGFTALADVLRGLDAPWTLA